MILLNSVSKRKKETEETVKKRKQLPAEEKVYFKTFILHRTLLTLKPLYVSGSHQHIHASKNCRCQKLCHD